MFTLLGFPVHVRSGFVVFMALIVVLYGDAFGLWLAGSLAVLTLLHELGHATAARRAGADAEISLSFFAGYASYTPTRPISRARQAWISFAGPGTQIVLSCAVLLALGANPIDPDSFRADDATLAIWWAGPAIGLLNLVPVLPLDGGNILLSAVDRVIPQRSQRVVLWFSIALTGLMAIGLFTVERYRGFGIFVAFLLISQLQMLGSSKESVSPWQAAADALHAGKRGRARRRLVAALSQPNQGGQHTMVPLDREDAAALVALLPDPFPRGDPWNEYVLGNLLIGLGRYEDAAHYAADSYARHPHALGAATVARASAAAGDTANAIGWLRAAAGAGGSGPALASVIDRSPELAALRDHPDVVAIRRSLTPAA